MNFFVNIKSAFSGTRGYLILCLSSIAIGLSLSKSLMFLGFSGLFIVWLISGDIKEKIQSFLKNRTALLISSIYLLTLLGLIYTSNFDFAISDVRRKIPLFFLPFFLSGFAPLIKKELYLLLKIYIIGVLVATLWSFFVYLGGLNVAFLDVREYSRFNSHIRFGLEIALAIFFAFFFVLKSSSISSKIVWASIGVWLISSMLIFSLFSGVIVFLATSFILLMVFGLLVKSFKLKALLVLSLLLLYYGLYLFIDTSYKSFYLSKDIVPIKEIPFTKDGDKYQKDIDTDRNTLKENGYYVAKNVAWGELAGAWREKSNIEFEGEDLKGQKIKNTLIRFITSKGLRKDRIGLESLTSAEIIAIENGVPNAEYLHMNYFSRRVHKILWEYNSYINGGDFNGHSILMRWEYWNTAIKVIKNNPMLGVGTGDIQDVFYEQYNIDNSRLEQRYRLRTHNQYLAFGVTFGLIGLAWFIICLLYPILKTKLYKNYLYLAFFSIAILSMLTEDTLETQVGINFFVFFNTLFLLNLEINHKKTSGLY